MIVIVNTNGEVKKFFQARANLYNKPFNFSVYTRGREFFQTPLKELKGPLQSEKWGWRIRTHVLPNGKKQIVPINHTTTLYYNR